VGDEHHRPPLRLEGIHLVETFPLELQVADGEHLVDGHDLGLEMRGDGEREPKIHSGRVALHGRVEEPSDTRELDDFLEAPLDLTTTHAENGTVEVDVLSARQLGVETRPDLEQGADAAPCPRDSGRRFCDAGDDLEQRGLPGAVPPNDPDGLSLLGPHAHVPQRPVLT
jgi:hypothetical protein